MSQKISTRFTDSIRDPKRPIEHTVLFEHHPQDPCPFSEFKLSGPHKGKKRLSHLGGLLWRADYVSSKTVQAAIEDGVDILSVRTERAALVANTSFKVSADVMKVVKNSPNWSRDGNCFKQIGVYLNEQEQIIKEVEFIVYTSQNKKRYIAEVRVCVREDGLDSDMFDDSVFIRENFLQWIRYGVKGRDGNVVDRHIEDGFNDDASLKFVITQ